MATANTLFVSHLSALDPSTKNSMHGLRYNTFKSRLGWEVPVKNGLEIDEYDDLNPVFIIAKNSNEVSGCMRLLPTTGIYMLKDTFPQLLNGEPAPVDQKIIEISRFTVNTQNSESNNTGVNKVSLALLQQLYIYGVENSITEYVFATTVSLMRYLQRIGIELISFGLGDKKSMRVGKEQSIALRLRVNEQFAISVGL